MQQSKLFSFLETVTNIIQLSLLWVVFSLPLITLFPATVAMFSVIRLWMREGDASVYRPFWQQFTAHFKQSILAGLLLWGVGAISYASFFSILHLDTAQLFFLAVFLVFFIWFICFALMLGPVMAHFSWPLLTALKNTVLLTVGRLPVSLLLLVLFVISLSILYSMPLAVFVVAGAAAYVMFAVCYKMFQKLQQD